MQNPRKAVDDFLQDYRDKYGTIVSKPKTVNNKYYTVGTKADVLETYGPIEDWDMSLVTNLEKLFYSKKTMNADLSSWDVSGVIIMEQSM